MPGCRPDHPVSFTMDPTGSSVYGNRMPLVNALNVTSLITLEEDSRPVVFSLEGTDANGGTLLCNLGLPVVKGLADLEAGDRQLQWTLNAIMSAFARPVDITRAVRNELAGYLSAGTQCHFLRQSGHFFSGDPVRNLSDVTIQNIQLAEKIQPYFRFSMCSSGDAHNISGNMLTFNISSLAAHSEQKIIYQLITPVPDSEIHEDVDDYLAEETYITPAFNTRTYTIGWQADHTA